MPNAGGYNSIISGEGHNGAFVNSNVSGSGNISNWTQFSVVSGTGNNITSDLSRSLLTGENVTITSVLTSIVNGASSTLNNVSSSVVNVNNGSTLNYVSRGFLFGSNIQAGVGATAAATDRSDDVFTFGGNHSIGKSASVVLSIGDGNTIVDDATGTFAFGVNHNASSAHSIKFGLNSVTFTGQTSNDIISTDYLEIYGNGSQTSVKSNARTTLKDGSVQFNNTGFGNPLTQAEVTPKSALEVVSVTSGIIPPQLTDAAAIARVLEINTNPSFTKSLPGGWDDRIGETWFNLDLGTHERVIWNGTTYIKQTY